MGENKWELLGKLRSAVKKIKIVLNFTMNKWAVASLIVGKSGRRRMSFQDRPGLRAIGDASYNSNISSYGGGSSSGRRSLHRTTSCPLEEDVDKRAEAFIANFYKQLELERQISLELRYSIDLEGQCL